MPLIFKTKNFSFIFCLLCFLFSGCTKNDYLVSTDIEYKSVTDLCFIDSLLTEAMLNPKDILVVFDFNYTLMYPSIPCLHKNNIDAHKDIFKEILKKISHEQADLMLTRLMATKNQKLINDQLSTFLKKHSDVNFLVCSSSLEKNAEAYLNLLNENNITITNNYNIKNFRFLDFKEYLSGHPIYKNGIITTNRRKKGEVLINFLKRISRKPKLIIFIDNSADKLDDVKFAVKSLKNMKLIIVEYSEYKNIQIPKVSEQEFKKYWNKQVENFLNSQNSSD